MKAANRFKRLILKCINISGPAILSFLPSRLSRVHTKSISRILAVASIYLTPLLLVLALFYSFLIPFATRNIEQFSPPKLIAEYKYDSKRLRDVHSLLVANKLGRTSNEPLNAYRPPIDPIYVSLTIKKLTDLDVNDGTLYVEGSVNALWSTRSFATNDPLWGSAINEVYGIDESVKEDILTDITFPDAVRDDKFFLQKKRHGKQYHFETGKQTYFSDYDFGGTFNFKPSLKSYPADTQTIRIVYTFESVHPFLVNFSGNVPNLFAINPENLKFGSHKLLEMYDIPTSIRLPEDPIFGSLFSQRQLSRSDIRNVIFQQGDQFVKRVRGGDDSVSAFDLLEDVLRDPNTRLISGVGVVFRRVTTLFMFRTLLPIDLVLLGGVINTFVPRKMSDVRLAVPPTLLLSLVFMQQSNSADLPMVTYITYIDVVYYLAYISTVLLMIESVVVCFVQNEAIRTLASRAARAIVLSIAIVGTKIAFPLMSS